MWNISWHVAGYDISHFHLGVKTESWRLACWESFKPSMLWVNRQHLANLCKDNKSAETKCMNKRVRIHCSPLRCRYTDFPAHQHQKTTGLGLSGLESRRANVQLQRADKLGVSEDKVQIKSSRSKWMLLPQSQPACMKVDIRVTVIRESWTYETCVTCTDSIYCFTIN